MATADLRALPILDVLLALGWDALAFKVRNRGTDFYGKCPIHGGNDLTFSFSVDGRYECASCQARGRGAISLTMDVKKCAYEDAVAFLKAFRAELGATNNRAKIS
jgi:DNA primase